MQYYLAPMEGITGYVFRRAQQELFEPLDKYVTPFLAPNQNRCMNTREKKDVLPEHNTGGMTAPQILTNQAEVFLNTCRELKKMGYQEINLNLGCPSGTVTAKGRGAGFLAFPQKLDGFLEQVFAGTDCKISIKTRLGIQEPEEFFTILEIFNRYPLEELIIHPRVQKDFYKNKPNWEVFREAVKRSRHPVCYNGDLFTLEDLQLFQEAFPQVNRVMLGRGMVVNPGFLNLLPERGGDGKTLDQKRLWAFHDRLLSDYGKDLSGDKNLLFKMKELWFYLIRLFPDSEKEAKKIRKVQRLSEYCQIVHHLFSEKELEVPTHICF